MAAAAAKTYSLFDDPKLKEIFNSLPKEEQDKFKSQGEHMYSFDYTGGDGGENPEKKLHDSAAHIGEALKSGLLPSQLTQEEVQLMRTILGVKWYEKYGYTSEKD